MNNLLNRHFQSRSLHQSSLHISFDIFDQLKFSLVLKTNVNLPMIHDLFSVNAALLKSY